MLSKTKPIQKVEVIYKCFCKLTFASINTYLIHLQQDHKLTVCNPKKLICDMTEDRQIYSYAKDNTKNIIVTKINIKKKERSEKIVEVVALADGASLKQIQQPDQPDEVFQQKVLQKEGLFKIIKKGLIDNPIKIDNRGRPKKDPKEKERHQISKKKQIYYHILLDSTKTKLCGHIQSYIGEKMQEQNFKAEKQCVREKVGLFNMLIWYQQHMRKQKLCNFHHGSRLANYETYLKRLVNYFLGKCLPSLRDNILLKTQQGIIIPDTRAAGVIIQQLLRWLFIKEHTLYMLRINLECLECVPQDLKDA